MVVLQCKTWIGRKAFQMSPCAQNHSNNLKIYYISYQFCKSCLVPQSKVLIVAQLVNKFCLFITIYESPYYKQNETTLHSYLGPIFILSSYFLKYSLPVTVFIQNFVCTSYVSNVFYFPCLFHHRWLVSPNTILFVVPKLSFSAMNATAHTNIHCV